MVGRRMRFSLDASEANCGALYPIIIFEGKEFRLLSFLRLWCGTILPLIPDDAKVKPVPLLMATPKRGPFYLPELILIGEAFAEHLLPISKTKKVTNFWNHWLTIIKSRIEHRMFNSSLKCLPKCKKVFPPYITHLNNEVVWPKLAFYCPQWE